MALYEPYDYEVEESPIYPEVSTSTPLQGFASWYDYGLEDEPLYSEYTSTCASRDFAKGTILRVSTESNSIFCRVNDWVENPDVIIDLSSFAFKKLALLKIGIIEVNVENAFCSCMNYLRYKGVDLPPPPVNAEDLKPNADLWSGDIVLQNFDGVAHAGLYEITNDGLWITSWNRKKCKKTRDLVRWENINDNVVGFYESKGEK